MNSPISPSGPDHARVSPGTGEQWRLVLGIALLFGLLYGFVEAIEATTLSMIPGALSWRNGNSPTALLFMPPFYVVVFLILSLPVLLLALVFPRVAWDRIWGSVLVGFAVFLATRLQGAVFSPLSALILGAGFATVFFRWYRNHPLSAPRLARVLVGSLAGIVLIGIGTRAALAGLERSRLHRLSAAEPGTPNVLILVMDTQRADHIHSYGYPLATSPSSDRLGSEGTTFLSAYSTSSWTLPAHASMFTGRPLREHRGGECARRYLDDKYPVVAEALGQNGYATGGFVANRFWTGRHSGLARGFVHYEDYYGGLGDAVNRTVIGLTVLNRLRPKIGLVDIPGRKRSDQVNAHLLSWLDGIGKHPFFIFANYFDVHAPYIPPPEVLGTFGGTGQMDPEEAVDIGVWSDIHGKPNEDRLLRWLLRYDESLLFMDRHIGMLLDALRERGLLDNTLVILTSDHGEDFGEKGLIHHGNSLYLTEVRVPLIVRYPPAFAAGTEVRAPVSLVDIPATIARLTAIPDSAFPGPSLLDASGPGGDQRMVLSEIARRPEVPKTWPSGRGWIKSFTTAKWHYIVEQLGKIELYDMDRDSSEKHNLAADPAYDSVVTNFNALMGPLLPDSASRRRLRC